MKSRILSLAAIAGMLAATGCSGGGAGTAASGLAKALPPGTPITTTRGAGSISASFLVPIPGYGSKAAAAAGRSAEYLSPGTSGIEIFLGDGNKFAAGGAGAQGSAQLTGSAPANNNVTNTNPINTEPLGANRTSISISPQSFTGNLVVGQYLTLLDPGQTNTVLFQIGQAPADIQANQTVLTGSFLSQANATAVGFVTPVGQTYDVSFAGVGATVVGLFPAGSLVSVYNPATAGLSANGQQPIVQGTNTANPGNNPAALTGAAFVNPAGSAGGVTLGVPTTVFGANASTTVNYNFGTSTVAGYYQFNVNISNLAANTYTLGVVTTDYQNSNPGFVLSEAQSPPIVVTANGTATSAFTLAPVVKQVIMVPPTLNLPNALGSNLPAPLANTTSKFETTVFAVDSDGYTVPTINALTTAANAPVIQIKAKTANTDLVYSIFGAYNNVTGAPGTSLTTVPTAAAVAATNGAGLGAGASLNIAGATGGAVDLNLTGTYFTNIASSTPNAGPTFFPNPNATVFTPLTSNAAGNPVLIGCGTTGTALMAQTQSVTTTAIGQIPGVGQFNAVGFTFTPGGNVPPTAATVYSNLPSINCTPGIGAVIN